MNNLNAIEEIDRIVDLLEEFSKNDPCDTIYACPYINDEKIDCAQCGVISSFKMVKKEVEIWKKSQQLSQT